MSDTLSTDILRGAKQIGGFIGENPRRVMYLADRHALPVFRMGAAICCRKSTLIRWIEVQERLTP